MKYSILSLEQEVSHRLKTYKREGSLSKFRANELERGM